MKAYASGEPRKSLVDEVIANVTASLVTSRVLEDLLGSFACKFEHMLGNFGLCAVRVPCDVCDPTAIHVACFKLHQRVGSGGVTAERGVNDDERFDDADPIAVGDGTHTRELIRKQGSGG